MKRNPTDRTAKAGQIVPLVVTRTIEAAAPQAQRAPKVGKLGYQAKPKKRAANDAKSVAPQQRVERRIPARGQYLGNGDRLTAFVWLDEDTAPQGNAANDQQA